MACELVNGKTKNTLQDVKYVPVPIEQNICEYETRKPDSWFLYFTVITGILTWFVGGTSVVWPSPAILKLQSNGTDINPIGRPITTGEISILLGMPGVISLFGSSLLPKLADLIGRKKSMQLMGFGLYFSMLGLAFSNKIELIITLYILVSTIFAGIMGVFPIYLAEICEDHNRTKYGCLTSVCLPLGQLYTYSIGPILSIKYYTILLSCPLIPFLIMFFFVPESPVYSSLRGRKDECMRSLMMLRSNKSFKEIEKDFVRINKNITLLNKKTNNICKLFRTKEGRVGLLLALIPMLTQFLSGVPVLMPLMGPIFNNSGSNLSGNTIATIVGSVKLICFTLTFLIVERAGRRPLLILSALGSGIFMTLLGTFFYLNHIKSPVVENFQWVPLVGVICFFTCYGLGLGLIPIAMISVLFPVDLRSVATSFIVTFTYSLVAVYLTVYPLLAEAIGAHWCMWIFAATSFLGGFIMYKILPETKGKSTEEIQEILKKF